MTKRVDIEELRRLEREATPGGWFIQGGHNDYAIYGNQTGSKNGWAIADRVFELNVYKDPQRQERDAAFVIALRNAAPALISELEQARETIRRMREVARLAHVGPSGYERIPHCTLCGGIWRAGKNVLEIHAAGCLAAPDEEDNND